MSSLQDIRNQVINCKKCHLHKTRTYAVPGEGNTNSEIVLVGEAPGAKEDRTGRPFVGAAGQLLDELIQRYLRIERDSVFITNLVKCRPPNNRDPSEDEIVTCSPYLLAQINLIKPKIIVTLGRHSTRFFQNLAKVEEESISKCHGKPFYINLSFGTVRVFPSYHPAAVLYNRSLKSELEKDFQLLSRLISTSSKSTTLDYFLDQHGPGN